jgi:hypothetical protein
MRRYAVLLMLAAGCSGGSGGPSEPVQQFGGVSGRVLATGDTALAGIAIAVQRASHTTRNAVTDGAGNFQVLNLETGSWNVTASPAAGYEAAGALTASVSVAANQTVAAPVFRMRRIVQNPPPPPPPPNFANVEILDNLFSPTSVTIAAGGTVRWTNNGAAVHNSTSATGLWSSGNLNPTQIFERSFPTAGTFSYTCTLHAGMSGTVIVQ